MTKQLNLENKIGLKDNIRERVIIIDDEIRMCESLTVLLTDSGYDVVAFGDSDQAAREIKSGHFDIIISDIKMPGMTGLDLLRIARQVDSQALVILMTGYGSMETAVEAINEGAYDYLLKPVEFSQLELVIKRGLEKRRLGRAKSFLLTELQDKNQKLEDRVIEINALYEVGKTLGSTLELKTLLDTIVRLATSVLHAEIGSIMLLDEGREFLTIAAAIGLSEEIQQSTQLPIGSSIAGHVAASKEPLFVADVNRDERFKKETKSERYGKASLLSVPLMVKNNVIGVINMSKKASGGDFGQHDLKLLTTFATQAAVAIDNAANFDKLKRRVAELSALHEISDAMSKAGTMELLYDIIFVGIRNLMPIEVSLWFRWSRKEKKLVFVGGAGNADLNLELAIESEPEGLDKDNKWRDLILENLGNSPSANIPTESFETIAIRNEAGLAYIFCLGSSVPNSFSREDLKIAGLIATQTATMYEREKGILNATRLLTMGNMISEISHDMRKPLTNIRGGLQVIRGRWPEMAEESDLFQMTEEEVHHLNELVRELVDFSNPNKYQTERIEIGSIINRVVQLLSRDFEEKKIEVQLKLDDDVPELLVNKNQIMEMYINLLTNAVDASSEGGKIKLSSSVVTGDIGKRVKLEISDTGCGISKDDLAVIFDRYYTSKETGTGLGLAAVERIVAAHGGNIEVKSIENQGTTFTIYLPQ